VIEKDVIIKSLVMIINRNRNDIVSQRRRCTAKAQFKSNLSDNYFFGTDKALEHPSVIFPIKKYFLVRTLLRNISVQFNT
jgi:hypothetical protein